MGLWVVERPVVWHANKKSSTLGWCDVEENFYVTSHVTDAVVTVVNVIDVATNQRTFQIDVASKRTRRRRCYDVSNWRWFCIDVAFKRSEPKYNQIENPENKFYQNKFHDIANVESECNLQSEFVWVNVGKWGAGCMLHCMIYIHVYTTLCDVYTYIYYIVWCLYMCMLHCMIFIHVYDYCMIYINV